MSEDFDRVTDNLTQGETWLRILFMVGFSVALYVVAIVLLFVTVAQALFAVVSGSDNGNLRVLGANLAEYVNQILRFLTYNSQLRPFPFSPFPDSSGSASPADEGDSPAGESDTDPDEHPGGDNHAGVPPDRDADAGGQGSKQDANRGSRGDGAAVGSDAEFAQLTGRGGRPRLNGSHHGATSSAADAGENTSITYSPATSQDSVTGSGSTGAGGQQSASLTKEKQTMSQEENSKPSDKSATDNSRKNDQIDPAGLADIQVKKTGSKKDLSTIFSDLEFNTRKKGADAESSDSKTTDRD